MLKRFIQWAEDLRISVWKFLILVAIFSATRAYIGIITFKYADISRLAFLNCISYHLMDFIFILFMLKAITNERIDKISSIMTLVIPLIILPPIIDKYIPSIFFDFVSLYSTTGIHITGGYFENFRISIGQLIEKTIIILLLGAYIYDKLNVKKNLKKFILAVFSPFFIFMSLYIMDALLSWIIYKWAIPSGSFDNFTKEYPYIISNFLYILIGFILFWLTILLENPKKVWVLLKDASPPRVIHFSLMFILGFVIQFEKHGPYSNVYLNGNILMALIGVFSAASGWAFVVAINNYYDKEEDEITNQQRGLASKKYSEINLLNFAILALSAGAYTSLILGLWPLIFYALFTFLGFAYSYPRIHLKKYGVKTIIIGLGSSILFGMGYTSPWYPMHSLFDRSFWTYFVILFAVFSTGSAMNDLKDFESDRIHDIKTIFTIFGIEKGKIIGSVMLIVAFSLPSILAPVFTPVFIGLAILGVFLLIKEKVTYIYFVYFTEYLIILFFHGL